MNVISSGDKTHITVLVCVLASGYTLPPMVIYKRKYLTPELIRGEIEGAIYELSLSADLFYEWFHQHFLEYAPSVRPLLLLLDGHSSHYNPVFIRCKAYESGVIVFCLPLHTTHLCQPLDVTCFHSLKTYWDNACDQYMFPNPSRVVTIYQFSQLLSIAWNQAMAPRTIMSGFKATGIFPLNRYAIMLPGKRPRLSNTPTAILAKKKGISFMSFYSPTHATRQPFTSEEQECFQRHYEEGYDLTDDERYNLWIKAYHPEGLQVQLILTHLPDSLLQLLIPSSLSPSNPFLYSPPISPEFLPQFIRSPSSSPVPLSTPVRSPSPPSQVKSKLSEFLPVPAPVTTNTTSKKSAGVCGNYM